MKTKDYRGITLIALIITIIVLLILAGVSISMVVGDNGILTQAVNATTATDVADTKEQIQVALVGYLDSNGDYTLADVEQAVADAGATLGEDGVTVTTAKGNTFDISDIVDGAVVSWYYDTNDDGDTIVTNGSVTLAIGDTVNYKAVTGATTTSITSYSTENGFGDLTFALTSDDDYSWQVMGADEDTGELLIVLSYCSGTGYNYIKTGDSNSTAYYYLKGQTGYANCADELDNICSLFGQGYGATGARSITVEDVNKLTGYDPEDIDGEGTAYGNGTIYEYGNKVTYFWQGTNYPYYSCTNEVTGSLSMSHNQDSYNNSFYWYDETNGWQSSPYNSEAVLEEITTLTNNYYYYTKSNYSTNSSVVFPSSGYYWLASPYVSCSSAALGFGCRRVDASSVTGTYLFNSHGSANSSYNGVRPAVSLSSDISLSGSSSEGWTID